VLGLIFRLLQLRAHQKAKLSSVFDLLLSMIVLNANDLPLIRWLGSAFIFQGLLTRMPRKTNRLLMAALCLVLTVVHSQAGLGWTLAQFKQQYGKPLLNQEQVAGRIGYVFTGEDFIIAAFFRNTQVSRILYICRGDSVIDSGKARALLRANAPDAIWDDASKNEADNSYRVNGRKDGAESYYASLTGDGKMLAIWTKEDDEAGRTKPGLDTPEVPSVVGANEKSTGAATAGNRPSMDSELAPEINHPDVPANPTSRQPAPGYAFQTKIARVKPRSSIPRGKISHLENFDAKARSTAALAPPPVRGHPPAPTPLIMNAGTGLYNSDYTQPFKNPTKVPVP
jgi:hypothetical protein